MQYKIVHVTEYVYQNWVSFCHNQAILKPLDTDMQQLLDYEIIIDPKPSEIDGFRDFFGNYLIHFVVQNPHQVLRVTSKALIKKKSSLRAFDMPCTLLEAKNALNGTQYSIICAKQFLFESPLLSNVSNEITHYAQAIFDECLDVYQGCLELTKAIYEEFEFVSGSTDVTTSVNDVFKEKKGVCQDFAHLAIACVRAIGLPARYVSGYIETLPPKGQEKLIGADASHAWFSVFIPQYGWVEFDPTNNCVPDMQHITVAYGRDYGDVVPLKGVILSSGNNYLKVSVDISRIEYNSEMN